MKNIRVSVSDEEYGKILKMKGTQTHRELFLKSLGFEAPPKKLGRPSASDIALKLDAMRQEYRLYEQDLVKETLKVHKTDDELSTFELAQKRRREQR